MLEFNAATVNFCPKFVVVKTTWVGVANLSPPPPPKPTPPKITGGGGPKFPPPPPPQHTPTQSIGTHDVTVTNIIGVNKKSEVQIWNFPLRFHTSYIF